MRSSRQLRRRPPAPTAVFGSMLTVLLVVLAVVGAVVLTVVGVFDPAPAAAHTVGGVDASNYRTTIRTVSPALPGVAVKVLDLGDRLELTNRGRVDVVVEGYDGEPYLRVGPRGVFENARSPARFLNRVRTSPEPAPPTADPTALPEWRRIGSSTTVRWHDHRAHWMSPEDPSIVRRAPGEEHLIQRFAIAMRVGNETVMVRGDLRWVPGPSPWPWIAGAVVLAGATIVAARGRRGGIALGLVLAVALAAAVVHAVGSWTVATGSAWARAGDALPTVGALVLGAIALVRLARRGVHASAPLLVFAGLFVGIAIGIADLSALSHSQLPTDLPPALDRLTITLALGGGFGVAIGAALHVTDRRPREMPTGQQTPATVG